jgi:hypothetical protein
VAESETIIRAARLGRRQPAGQLRYAAERLVAVLERGDEVAPNLLAVVGILEAVADQLQGPSPLRVRSSMLRQTHEAVRTRFGLLLAVCGSDVRNPVEAEEGCEVTCPMCNGTLEPITRQEP